ncbi:hypothetical protein DFH08DRAFT_814322 [Mycena albidolilacea]|uniref:Uncharacterized protein n=1 Tax=Mycena albidolilacea TaxID=1033008 RepID=A0AAD7EJX5_9AGAR|nr:hypothetical protein DFH08DRAFT_814322 [Mycena albidolilacea]
MASGESAAGFCAEGEGLYKSESSEGVPGGQANGIRPSDRALILSIKRQRAKSGQRRRNRNNKRESKCSNTRVIAIEGSSSKGAAHPKRLCADQGAEDAGRQHNMRRPTCTSSIFVERAMYSEAGSDPHRAAEGGGRWAVGSGQQETAGSDDERRAAASGGGQRTSNRRWVRFKRAGYRSTTPERAGRLLKSTSKRRARAAAAAQLQEPVEPVNGRCKLRSEPGWCIDQSKEQRPGGRANGSKQKGCWWSKAAKRIRK